MSMTSSSISKLKSQITRKQVIPARFEVAHLRGIILSLIERLEKHEKVNNEDSDLNKEIFEPIPTKHGGWKKEVSDEGSKTIKIHASQMIRLLFNIKNKRQRYLMWKEVNALLRENGLQIIPETYRKINNVFQVINMSDKE